jgi:hypothetical protein
MPIEIDSDLEAKLRSRAEAHGLTLESYLRRIADEENEAEEEIEALALEGLRSGEPIVADERYWEDKHRLLIERHLKRSQ